MTTLQIDILTPAGDTLVADVSRSDLIPINATANMIYVEKGNDPVPVVVWMERHEITRLPRWLAFIVGVIYIFEWGVIGSTVTFVRILSKDKDVVDLMIKTPYTSIDEFINKPTPESSFSLYLPSQE